MTFRWTDAKDTEILPGFLARFLHSERMTFVKWDIRAGGILPEHSHPHEQVAHILAGQFELTVGGNRQVAGAGEVIVIPPNARHSGRAITDCEILDAFCPVREDYRGTVSGNVLQTAAIAPKSVAPPADRLPDYRTDAAAYEEEELARPDEMAMIDGAAEAARTLLVTRPSAAVLDLCCGTGLSLRGVIREPTVTRAVGVDNCSEYLAFAAERFRDTPHLQLVHGDAVTTELERGAWDLIMLASAYHHIEDERKVAFLTRVAGLLAPGGRAVFAENILPPYRSGDRDGYQSAVSLFYDEVLKTAEAGNPTLPERVRGLIRRVAKYGCDGDYEYKVCLDVFLGHLAEAGLRIVEVRKVWPARGPLSLTTGGNYVIVASADGEGGDE